MRISDWSSDVCSSDLARGQDRHAGARHLRSALLRLAEGGRCVAIMSPTFAHDASGASGYVSVAEIARPRVELTILGRPYAKHGTSVAIRLIVFDKGWLGHTEQIGRAHVCTPVTHSHNVCLLLLEIK